MEQTARMGNGGDGHGGPAPPEADRRSAMSTTDVARADSRSGKAGPARPDNSSHGLPSTGIRNVALVGHNGSGKTTLAEALLFATGAINRQGKVDDGSTVSDFEPEEIKYHMSLSLALTPCQVGEVKLNIIDTPGYADFFGEVRAACSVVDLVIVVVSAVEGVEAQTEAAWALAGELGLPRLVFVNKLDREQASFDRTLADLARALRRRHRPAGAAGGRGRRLPGDRRPAHRHRHHLRRREADVRTHPERPGRHRAPGARAAGRGDRGRRRRPHGALPRRGHPYQRRAEATLATGVAQGVVFPVVCGSAATGVGIDRLATLLAEIAPSPDGRPPVEVQAGDSVQEVAVRPGRPAARPGVQDLLRSLRGQHLAAAGPVRARSTPTTSSPTPAPTHDERLHVLQLLRGKQAQPTDEARAGDIVAAPKLAGVATGDTLAPKGVPVLVPSPPPEPAALSVAIRPRSKGDEDKLMTGLHRLQEEDPTLIVERVDETHQTILRRHGRDPPGHVDRAAGPEVRRRGRDRGRAHPLPRDHHHGGRGGREVQEADRRSRPVRRGVDPHRAPASAGRASASSTRWWAGPSPGSTSRRWRRGSSSRWATAASTATRWSTCRWPVSTGSTTRSTRRR